MVGLRLLTKYSHLSTNIDEKETANAPETLSFPVVAIGQQKTLSGLVLANLDVHAAVVLADLAGEAWNVDLHYRLVPPLVVEIGKDA
jgi:hypothetical protein